MKGILFKPDMIKAILEGRKTQTRRLGGLKEINQEPDKLVCQGAPYGIWRFDHKETSYRVTVIPLYHIGETVYLKEAWTIGSHSIDYPTKLEVLYKTVHDDNNDRQWVTVDFDTWVKYCSKNKWRNPRTMPAWAARYFVQITGTGAERLQEITIGDAIAEGCSLDFDMAHFGTYKDPITKYRELWDSINPKYPWTSNLWVWKYSFKLVDRRR